MPKTARLTPRGVDDRSATRSDIASYLLETRVDPETDSRIHVFIPEIDRPRAWRSFQISCSLVVALDTRVEVQQ